MVKSSGTCTKRPSSASGTVPPVAVGMGRSLKRLTWERWASGTWMTMWVGSRARAPLMSPSL